jgi:hypothetical protein
MKCVICDGTGIQEETMKGYRRYKCWKCSGEGKINLTKTTTDETLIEQEKDTNEQNK